MNVVRWLRWGLVGLLVGVIAGFSPDIHAESLTLDECINIALQRNVSVANARYSLDLARQNVWSAWGDWLPQFSTSMSYNYNEQGGASQFAFTSPISRRYTRSIGFQQTLFRWGGNWFNVKNSLLQRKADEHRLSQSELETIDLVKNYYFLALKNRGLLQVAEQSVESAEQNLRLVQARFDLGSANQSELLKAKVQSLSNRASLEQSRRNRAVSLAQLNNAMNRLANVPLELDARADTIGVAITFAEALNFADEHHPKIMAARADLQAARYNKLIAKTNYLPTVSIGGSRSFSAGSSKDWFRSHTREWVWVNQDPCTPCSQDYALVPNDVKLGSWSFGVSLSWPIPFFDGFSRKTSHSRAKAGHKLAKLELESTVNGVSLDIQTALLDIHNARANLILFDESLRSAEEDLEIAQERYNLGAATVLDLLDAEENLAYASNQFVSAKFDFNLAVSALYKAMGKRQ